MPTRSARPALLVLTTLSFMACTDRDATAPSRSDLAVAATATYTVQALSIPSEAFEGEARGINDAGGIAGFIRNPDKYAAVRWTTTNLRQDLGDLPGLPSDIANDVNLSESVVGFSFGSAVSFARAWVWTRAAGMQALPDLGGNASIALAINGSGTIVGWAADSFGTTHAARWDAAGQLTDLNPAGGTSIAIDINDAGDIVGWTFPLGAIQEHAHLWRHDGQEFDLGTLGGPRSQAFGVNNNLQVVGVADLPPPDPEVAFGWNPARGIFSLDFGPKSEALAVSDRGRSVGLSTVGGVTGLTRFHDVVQILPDLAPAKGHFSGPTNVNRCGTIVGSSVSPSPTSAALIPVVWKNTVCD